MLDSAAGAHEPVLTLSVLYVQLEPEDGSGAGEAESGAREAEGCRPGQEPPAAGAHVRPDVRSAGQFFSQLGAYYCYRLFYVGQSSAGPKGTGQAGPERTGGDGGQLFL